MNKYGPTKENLLLALPHVLRQDSNMLALSESISSILSQRWDEIDLLRIYQRIDELDEELLDILAYDFKVDWWDPNYSLDVKRQTLKDNWRVHRMLGTKAALEVALSAIYPAARAEEWWEYGGMPYCFRLYIDASDADIGDAKHRRVMERVNYWKNLRSHLEGIEYHKTIPTGTAYAAVGVITRPHIAILNARDVLSEVNGRQYAAAALHTDPHEIILNGGRTIAAAIQGRVSTAAGMDIQSRRVVLNGGRTVATSIRGKESAASGVSAGRHESILNGQQQAETIRSAAHGSAGLAHTSHITIQEERHGDL